MKNQNGVLYYGRVIIFGESRSNEKTAYRVRLGNIAADMLITNVNVFHLSDGTLEQCDIAIGNGKIAGLGEL